MSDFNDRLAASDPAARAPYEHRDLDAMISRITATPAVAPSTHWQRVQAQFAGALIAGSLVAAVAVGIFQSSPALSMLAIKSTPTHSSTALGNHAPGTFGAMQIYARFNFSAGPSLDTTTPASPSYELQLPSGQSEAARIASIFGVVGTPVDTNGNGSDWTVTSSSGSSLDYQNSGVPQWYYSSTSPSVAPATESSSASQAMPSDSTLEADAQAYLAKLGYDYSVSSPSFSSSTSSVTNADGSQSSLSTKEITYEVDVNSVSTDQTVSFSVDANNTLVYAQGPSFRVGSPVNYPLQSPSGAISALNAAQQSKFTCDTCASMGSGANSPTPSSAASPTTTLAGPPTINVTLTSQTVTLQSYVLPDGSVWMLPVYSFSGNEAQTDGTTASGTWSELAVDPAYVSVSGTSNGSHGVINY